MSHNPVTINKAHKSYVCSRAHKSIKPTIAQGCRVLGLQQRVGPTATQRDRFPQNATKGAHQFGYLTSRSPHGKLGSGAMPRLALRSLAMPCPVNYSAGIPLKGCGSVPVPKRKTPSTQGSCKLHSFRTPLVLDLRTSM